MDEAYFYRKQALEALKKRAKADGMGMMARGSYDKDFAVAARLLAPDERVVRVLSKSMRLLVFTDRRLITLACALEPHEIASVPYLGFRDIEPNRQFLNNGVAVTYRGEPLVLELDKKHIDAVVDELRQLAPQQGAAEEFTDSQAVIHLLMSEIDGSDLAVVEQAIPVLSCRVQPTEQPIAAAIGQYRGVASLLLLTDRRLLIVNYQGSEEGDAEVPISMMKGAEVSPGVWNSRLAIRAHGERHDFTWANKSDGERIAQAINGLLASNSAPASPTAQPSSTPQLIPDARAADGGGTDVVAQLERLAGLHRDGILSADEFARAKQRVLGA